MSVCRIRGRKKKGGGGAFFEQWASYSQGRSDLGGIRKPQKDSCSNANAEELDQKNDFGWSFLAKVCGCCVPLLPPGVDFGHIFTSTSKTTHLNPILVQMLTVQLFSGNSKILAILAKFTVNLG